MNPYLPVLIPKPRLSPLHHIDSESLQRVEVNWNKQ